MESFNISINGIEVVQKDNRYLLQRDGFKMYCGFGELNKGIPEFEEYSRRKNLMDRDETETIRQNDNLLYHYLGEVDNPEDMLYEFAPLKAVTECKGKTNWFICSDGTFFTCGDYIADMLFSSGKVVFYEFPFESKRNNRYSRLSRDKKVSFRMELQCISEKQARKIVCEEAGLL